MRLSLLLMAMPIAMYAQDTVAERITEGYPNTFSSGSSYVEKFDNKARKLNDWSISVGGGAAFMQSADLVSIRKDGISTGWNAYVSLDKQISHAFGLIFQYNMGETKQMGTIAGRGTATGTTKFQQINLLGDINFSNLIRRTDNKSPYRWALHGYAGIGLQGYKTKLTEETLPGVRQSWFVRKGGEIEQNLDIASFFYQGGIGLKYKVSRRVDVEARAMYIITGDDEFDGAGWESDVAGKDGVMAARTIDYPYNYIKKNSSDNFFTVNLGLSFKLGKHITHLAWYDPLQNAYARVNALEPTSVDLQVCEKGDRDNDGVCDDWDRQLDTPAGARVDGSGVALDMDLDGVIDLYDKCVTVPGPVNNQGCPTNK